MPVPTPGDLAARPRTVLTAIPVAAAAPALPPVEHFANPLEHYVHLVRRSGLHSRTVALALLLADVADPDTLRLGRATPNNGELGRALDLAPKAVRSHLHKLRLGGWMTRPAPQEGVAVVRPITLTIPDAAGAAPSGPS